MEILKVDIGLMGTENATYKLMDANNSVYEPAFIRRSLQEAACLLLIPKDDLSSSSRRRHKAESPSTSTGGQGQK